MSCGSPALQVHPLNADGSLNLLGLETVRLIYFKNKTAGEMLPTAALPASEYSHPTYLCIFSRKKKMRKVLSEKEKRKLMHFK